MPATPTDTDVLVIGAGCAGLGAATALREHGLTAIVLEAADRIGGRAWTSYPDQLGGCWFDMGAVWLHWAERNPLVPIAQAAGDTLLRSDELRRKRTFVGTREASPAEYADYEEAWTRYEAAADGLLRTLPDVPLAAVADHLPGDPWALTVEAFEGPVICVAEAEEFSLRDWRRNVLDGSNLVPQGGIGAFVERRLGVGLDIRLNTAATRLHWNGPGGRVTVETPRGTLSAGAAIVTASTGVLAAGGIAFDPPLPAEVQACVAALPMGLAMKVALRATGPDRLDLPLHCSVDRQVTGRGDRLVPFQCWPVRARLRAGMDRRHNCLGAGAGGRGSRGGFRAGTNAGDLWRPGGQAVLGRNQPGDALGGRSVCPRRLLLCRGGQRGCAGAAGPASRGWASAVRRRGVP